MKHKTTAAVCVIAATTFMASLTVPAFGGPDVLSSASPSSIAKKALKLAKRADARSKQALSESQKVAAKQGPVGQRGPAGAPGPSGAPGAAGPPGEDAFGSLTYVTGPGAGTSTVDDYAFDAAICAIGEAPTGGSYTSAGSELGGTNPLLGDYGDRALDLDDPPDGLPDSWVAWVYNSSGSAAVLASAVCAPVGSVAVATKSASRLDPLAEKLRELFAR